MQGDQTSEAPAQPTAFTLAPGAKIVTTDVQNDRLVLHIHNVQGDEIDIIDTESVDWSGRRKSAAPAK